MIINSISDSRFKNSFLRQLLFFYRKARFILRSWLELPGWVYWGTAKISTRNWQTAAVLLWMKSKELTVYEPETTECFQELLASSKCVWDLGAHVGYFSLLSSQKNIKTYAFEINPDFVKIINSHAARNRLVINVINKPLGKSGREIGYEDYSGISSGVEISADQFVNETGDIPDLIKIDIDGAEMEFLEGAETLFRSGNPKVIIELSKSRREEIISLMKKYGYRKIKELDQVLSHNALFVRE